MFSETASTERPLVIPTAPSSAPSHSQPEKLTAFELPAKLPVDDLGNWTQDEAISYEVARETFNALIACANR